MPIIIRHARVKVIEADLIVPFRIATGQHNTLHNVFLLLETTAGVKGYGEAAVATHITGETIEQTLANLNEAAAALTGEEASDYRTVLAGFREKFTGNHAGLAALEMALLDVWTRTLKVPLWSLFGSKPVPLASDITIVLGSRDEAETSDRHYARCGFKMFKIKVGKDSDADHARVLAVSRAAPRAGIILDANQGFSAAQTLSFVKALHKAGVRPVLVEQPVPKDDWDGLAQVTRSLTRAGVLICADESVKSLSDAVRAIKVKAVSSINIKLMKNGVLEAEAIARVARAAGMELMIGAMMESTVAISAAAHLAAGLGCFKFIDLDTTHFIKGPLSRAAHIGKNGVIDLGRVKSGLGITLTE